MAFFPAEECSIVLFVEVLNFVGSEFVEVLADDTIVKQELAVNLTLQEESKIVYFYFSLSKRDSLIKAKKNTYPAFSLAIA